MDKSDCRPELSETFQQDNSAYDEEEPQRGKPLSWKTGVGLWKRQKTLELLTKDVGETLLLLVAILMTDPNPETWFRRINERLEEFERLRKRLALQ